MQRPAETDAQLTKRIQKELDAVKRGQKQMPSATEIATGLINGGQDADGQEQAQAQAQQPAQQEQSNVDCDPEREDCSIKKTQQPQQQQPQQQQQQQPRCPPLDYKIARIGRHNYRISVWRLLLLAC